MPRPAATSTSAPDRRTIETSCLKTSEIRSEVSADWDLLQETWTFSIAEVAGDRRCYDRQTQTREVDPVDGSTDPHVLEHDEDALPEVVRQVLGRNDADVTSWRSTPLHGGAGGGALYRLTGSARAGSEVLPWSVICKIIRATEDAVDPASLRYWAREPLAYRSGALADLPGGLTTPSCHGITETHDGEFRFWLEDVVETRRSWTLEDYGSVARQLGAFNAAYLTGTPLPTWPWLNRAFVRSWIAGTGVRANVEAVRAFPDDPRVRRWYPEEMREHVLRLWDERETFLGALDRLPRTLCHMDAFRRNLLIRSHPDGSEQAVFLDWAFMGTGALGEELAALVAGSVNLLDADVGDLEALDRIAFQSYVAGARDAGWTGDPRAIRFAYAAASALRFALPPVIDLLDEASDPRVEQVMAHPMGEVVSTIVAVRRFLFGLADEARELLAAGL